MRAREPPAAQSAGLSSASAATAATGSTCTSSAAGRFLTCLRRHGWAMCLSLAKQLRSRQ
eukprot:3736021-Lingulodinium_polyedra.AAC.1